jgi:hypothetical protein
VGLEFRKQHNRVNITGKGTEVKIKLVLDVILHDALCSFKTSRTTHPTTHCHIPKQFTPSPRPPGEPLIPEVEKL